MPIIHRPANYIDEYEAPARLTAFAFEEINVTASSVGLTPGTYQPDGAAAARAAWITLEHGTPLANIRIRLDGLAPTETVGHRFDYADANFQHFYTHDMVIIVGQGILLKTLQAIALFRIIRATASANVDIAVTYFR